MLMCYRETVTTKAYVYIIHIKGTIAIPLKLGWSNGAIGKISANQWNSVCRKKRNVGAEAFTSMLLEFHNFFYHQLSLVRFYWL